MKCQGNCTSWLRRMCRSPHGERGLKLDVNIAEELVRHVSLPSRGAWIEIQYQRAAAPSTTSLPSRGAWIEIRGVPCCGTPGIGRSPHGERGLKSGTVTAQPAGGEPSLPSRGAWIEIRAAGPRSWPIVSLPSRGAWIEILPPGPWPVGRPGRSPHGERGLK